MTLYRVMAYAGTACSDYKVLGSKHDEFLVHAKDADRARAVVVAFLVKDGSFGEIPTFADPELSMCERVKVRAPEGIESVYMHHCQDHS